MRGVKIKIVACHNPVQVSIKQRESCKIAFTPKAMVAGSPAKSVRDNPHSGERNEVIMAGHLITRIISERDTLPTLLTKAVVLIETWARSSSEHQEDTQTSLGKRRGTGQLRTEASGQKIRTIHETRPISGRRKIVVDCMRNNYHRLRRRRITVQRLRKGIALRSV
ncbi:hypothetical protein [Mesorhizobium sp. 2RAF21]|uniref:hypothetical protein n=1 Tax=Mesorhizobium sp. 2RAF21 TaxID=3232995 RepID=UPI003F9E6B15